MAIYHFLSEVAKEYSIPIDKLENHVHEAFDYYRLKEIEHDQDTERFKRFVRQHDFKIVDAGTVVSYLKRLESEHFNRCVSFDLNVANKRIRIMKKSDVNNCPHASRPFDFVLKKKKSCL